jgi:tetratricopeptide (TPR) repeat protein
MNLTEKFVQIEAVFHEALTAPDAERAALIEARCEGDAEMAAEVFALLAACAEEERATATNHVENNGAAHSGPRRIGPYELERLLGRGGMGAVYLAHRADGQFEQQVAIKLIDLPLATDMFRERFRQERQILAALQHPYIARLLDGGVTADGELYLAMEYVAGAPIHRYCDEHNFSESQRIELFLKVCEAVQFAHQNFVVHRDLKPDNILVAEDGTPRLLDFGTAKLVSPSLGSPESMATREGYLSFTPQYASPEQVLGNPISTASDTYSLGVLLYLLLAGAQPYELKEMTTGEMLRVVCEEPPRKPAHSISGKRLDPDLESILLKALRKEPQQRYLTAEQLAGDLRAYQGGMPVGARRGTMRYRAGKFMRRHRLGIAAAALVTATVIAGIAGVLWQAHVAQVARRTAEARSADLRELSNSLLTELDDAIKDLPGSTSVQRLLVTRVLEHLDRMAKDADGDRQTQLDLVDAYTRLGNLQGNHYYQSLGDPVGAMDSLNKALALAQPLAKAGPSDTQAWSALALVQESRAQIMFKTGKTVEAVQVMEEAVKARDVLISAPHPSAQELEDTATAYGVLGDELGQPDTEGLNDVNAALAAYRKDLSLVMRALEADPKFERAQRSSAIVQMKIGEVEMEPDPTQALKDLDVALQRLNAFPKAVQANALPVRLRAAILHREAIAMNELGEYDRASDTYVQVKKLDEELKAEDPQDWQAYGDLEADFFDEATGYLYAADPELGATCPDRGRYLAQAETLLADDIAIIEIGIQHEPQNLDWKESLADRQVRFGTVHAILRTPEDGPPPAPRGLATLKSLASDPSAAPMVLDDAANDFLLVEPASLRDPQFALACAERELTVSHGKTPQIMLTAARAYRAVNEFDKSRAAAQQGLALLPAQEPSTPKSRLRRLLELEAR